MTSGAWRNLSSDSNKAAVSPPILSTVSGMHEHPLPGVCALMKTDIHAQCAMLGAFRNKRTFKGHN